MKLPFQIALRFLKSGKFQTVMIVIGIAVGVSVQVFIGSLISGLQKSLVDKTIGSSSQITIKMATTGESLSDYQSLVQDLERLDDELTIVSPNYTSGITIKSTSGEGTITEQGLLRGFDFEKANQIYKYDSKIVQGRMPSDDSEVAFGLLLFESLQINVDDFVEFIVPGSASTKIVKVVGVFDFNVRAINQQWVIAPLSTVQSIFEVGNVINTLEMQVNDVFEAEAISQSLLPMIEGKDLVIENWIEQNAELLSGLQGQSISSLMIQVFVMVSVVLAIASVLAITVLQKSKQIGILKAMGIQDKDASLVFLFEGLILGFFGAIGGVLLGLGLSFSFTTFAIGADGNPVVPLFIDFNFILLSAVIATLAATLAALIPARKSSKLSVIEVIRNA